VRGADISLAGRAGRGRDAPAPAAPCAGHLDAARHAPADPHLGEEPAGHRVQAIEVTTGAWVHRLGRRCAADFIALPGMLDEAFPRAPVIVVICDNNSIHHARAVIAYLKEYPRLELLYGARYSPHDNPVERIWAAPKNYMANTARRELARPPAAEPLLLLQSLTRPNAGHRPRPARCCGDLSSLDTPLPVT
jgi:hypothetical protein